MAAIAARAGIHNYPQWLWVPACAGTPAGKSRSYSSEPPPSPQIPCLRSWMSTAWAKDPGLSGGPGVWVLRSLTTRSRAASSSALLIPVAMISAASASPTGPRISATSSRDSSVIGRAFLTWRGPLLGGGGLRLDFCLARGAPFLEPADHDKERRHEQHGKAGRGEHPTEHRNADRLARAGAGAGCQHQWHHPENERERSHQNGPEPRARRFHRRLGDRLAVEYPPLACHFDDQDRILRRERAQKYQADLGIEIVVHTQRHEHRDRPDQG